MHDRALSGHDDDPYAASPPVDVTVVLPAYNEAENIAGIHRQVEETLARSGYSYEILFIDDGSTDGTWDRILAVARRDGNVRALRHRRNAGKATALANGFIYARGDIVVTSDADMQYAPEDMLRLVEKILDGYDVVSAHKVVRRDPLGKRLPSRFFNFFVRFTTGVQLHDMNAGLKAFRHEAADELVRYGYGELHRFFVVLAACRGFSVAEVPVESLYRTTGRSKYGMERYVRGALDWMTVYFLSGYAERPLHLLGGAGIGVAIVGVVMFSSLFAGSVTTGTIPQQSPFFGLAQVLLMVGGQMVIAGLIAEMVNNLQRREAGSARIADRVRIERRSWLSINTPGRPERRGVETLTTERPDRDTVRLGPELELETSEEALDAVAAAGPE